MAKGKSCSMSPYVGNEPSKMYEDLLKLVAVRPMANLIYAAYLQEGVAAQMDAQGYTKNRQGQHRAKDVFEFFDAEKMIIESSDVFNIARNIGATDNLGSLIDYADANEALEKAYNLNNSHKGVVAFVTQHGDKFNIIVDSRTSRTHLRANLVEEQRSAWDIIQRAFESVGVDINHPALDKTYINATKVNQFAQWLSQIQHCNNTLIPEKDIRTLLILNESLPQVTRLKTMFGSIDQVAHTIADAYVFNSVTPDQLSLINTTLTECKKLLGLDIAGLVDEIALNKLNSVAEEDYEIQKTLDELNKKFAIEYNEIHLIGNEINSLSEAAADAAVTLQRQLIQLTKTEGFTSRSLSVETALKTLTSDIKNNRYYSGILGFLGEAANQILDMQNKLNSLSQIPPTSNIMEKVREVSRVLMEVKRTSSGYYNILKALSKVDKLIAEETLSDTDKENIKKQATNLLKFFDEYEDLIRNLSKDTMISIATKFLGDKMSNGIPIANVVTMQEQDSSWMDYLYSMGRVSNPLIGIMDNIIRDAQWERDKKLSDFALRIRKEEHKLKKSGHKSDFIYMGNSGYIWSDINWNAFYRARAAASNDAKRRGLSGLSLEEAMQIWDDSHMEERVVDFKSGRTEKVPNSSFRAKEFQKVYDSWDQSQKDYYNNMMQIKGEIGSLLPEYAQRQYLAPQVRRSFIDALGAAVKKGSVKDFVRAILEKFKNIWTIREDDMDYAQNGIIDGEEYGIARGNLDNTPFRQIPIFYINRLEDPNELLKDFSSALQHLAGTAVNYEAMYNIKDTIEFMGGFIKNKLPAAYKRGKKITDVVSDSGIRIFKDLQGFANNTNTAGIIDGFINKHLYGIRIKNPTKTSKIIKSLIAYTSIRSLAVNVKGMISNYLVGEIQMLIESGAMEFYDTADYLWANAKVFGDNTTGSVGRIMDFLSNNVNSKSVLLADKFDPFNENFEELSNQRYFRGPLRHLLGTDFTFIGYGAGEHMLHFVNMYAVLHHTKIKINGKKANLYEAFSVGNKEDGNSELIINPNATYTNENGEDVAIDDEFIFKVKEQIRYVNQTTHGSMNEADKGLIHQHMLGKLVLNLRQWMVEHYSRRFRAEHWDSSLKENREGFYVTTARLFLAWGQDIFGFQRAAALHWKDMNVAQKANVRRAISEQLVLGLLLGLQFALGEPEDHKKEFWLRMWIYQVKRAIVDVLGSTPYGLPMEMNTLINSPMAATTTVNALLYPVIYIGDMTETVKRGKHKGENKWVVNMCKYWLPFYRQIEQLMDMDEDEGVFAIFDRRDMR